MARFIMMIGPSASGKSTFANNLSKYRGWRVISSDGLRKELYGDEAIQGDNKILFSQIHKMILESLEKDKSVIFDATNLSRKNRAALLEKISPDFYEKVAVVVATPFEKIYENNKNRARKVPEEVIQRQLHQFEMPVYAEGFNKILICTPSGRPYYPGTDAQAMMQNFQQDNPNHSLSLLGHCARCCNFLLEKEKEEDISLLSAAMFHDIGKVFTKTFKNMKGEETDIAHYYFHNNVGSYFSLLIKFGYTMRDRVEIAQLICYHMQPYFCKTEKAMKRWEEKLGSELWEKILKLHEADKSAH